MAGGRKPSSGLRIGGLSPPPGPQIGGAEGALSPPLDLKSGGLKPPLRGFQAPPWSNPGYAPDETSRIDHI